VAYANQNVRDYTALAEAVKSGRIKAETGVKLLTSAKRTKSKEN
jgi:hypothetical protein